MADKEAANNMKAKAYIYRNLRTGGFSVKYKGRVVHRGNWFRASDVEFKVSEAGRQRVLKEKQKNVHAYAVADLVWVSDEIFDNLTEITYNPYVNTQFMCEGKEINKANDILFKDGRCYRIE